MRDQHNGVAERDSEEPHEPHHCAEGEHVSSRKYREDSAYQSKWEIDEYEKKIASIRQHDR